MLKNWDFMRLLRAGLAGWAFLEAFRTGEMLLLLPGGLLAMQAVFNVGCCGSAACAAPPARSTAQAEAETVVFEEVT